MDFFPESFDAAAAIIPETLAYLVLLLEYVGFAVTIVLHRLGLCGPAEPPIPYWDDDLLLRRYFPITTASGVPPPSPLHCAPAGSSSSSSSTIKKQLRVVEFSSLLHRRPCKMRSELDDQEASTTCNICLGELEAEHKVRELGNCGHGFHVECIDGWVEVGRVTCPLCRANLLPGSGHLLL